MNILLKTCTALLALFVVLEFTGCSDDDGGSGIPDDLAASTNDMAVASSNTMETMEDSMNAMDDSQNAATDSQDAATDSVDGTTDLRSSDDATTVDEQTASAAGGVSQNTAAGCKLSGSWSGTFYNDIYGIREGITANVTVDGLNISINTSHAGVGSNLNGTINGQCGLRLIDPIDGEDWTTKFGGADSTQIRIADFVVEDRDPLTGETPLYVIELFR